MQEREFIVEENLDPEDWEELRLLMHRAVDDVIDYTRTLKERPAWIHAPDAVKEHFRAPLPQKPQPLEQVYQEYLEYVLPYPVGNIHPRFWGWVLGTGTLQGAFSELLAGVMNVGAAGGVSYHSANYVEYQVLDWLKEMLDFPTEASGLLTSGCSSANLIGLAVARNTKAHCDLRQEGLQKSANKMVLYASEQVHSSIQKAVELLGLGSDALRLVAVDDQFRIDLKALELRIIEDRQLGLLPFCVVGAAGTTNTGAVDDLTALAEICRTWELWLHVDGAFGAWAAIAPGSKHLVRGIELADSLAFDLHKWMYMPYEIACILVRSEENHRRAFSLTPEYLAHGEGLRGMTGVDLPWLHDYGYQLSRSFRALKAWMSLKEHGVEKYGRLIQQNIDQAQYLTELIQATPELELAAPVHLNVVCFRYIQPNMENSDLDEMNRQIIVELQERGIAVVSGTVIQGRYVLHAAICNHRSQRQDFEILVEQVIKLGRVLSAK